MRWHRHGHKKQANTPNKAETPAETAAKAAAAREIRGLREARAGTAAERPGLVVTPDKKMHSGAFIEDTFYEDRGSSFVQTPWRSAEEREKEIEQRAVLVENNATKDVWWLDQAERRPKEHGGWTVRGNG